MSFLASLQFKLLMALSGLGLIAAVFSVGFLKGHNQAALACAAEALKAELAETIRQRDAANQALAESTRLHGQQADEIIKLETQVEAYVKELDQRPGDGDACILSDDVARRLRAIK